MLVDVEAAPPEAAPVDCAVAAPLDCPVPLVAELRPVVSPVSQALRMPEISKQSPKPKRLTTLVGWEHRGRSESKFCLFKRTWLPKVIAQS